MTVQPTTQPTELMDEVAALARERVSGEDLDLVLAFVTGYYARVSPDDLAERKAEDLYGAAAAHLNLARRRTLGTPKVRVYNPQIEQHGWQSTHTIVEIVTDDMPFLIDSVRMVLNRRGYTSHLVIHPVMRFRREEDGRVGGLLPLDDAQEDSIVEAVIHIEGDRQTEPEVLDAIEAEMRSALDDVRAAVQDWSAMREQLRRSIADLRASPPPVRPEELEETCAFLEWIENNHFTFLGFGEFRVEKAGSGEPGGREHGGREPRGRERYVAEPGTGLGLLRDEGGRAADAFSNLPPPRRRRDPQEPDLLVLTRADIRSTVHRPSHLDYIGIRQFDAEGRVRGVRRFLGLYTSTAYNRVPRDIPLLRRKAADVLGRAGYPRNSHAAKALQNTIDTFPREMLFQIPADQLFETSMGILHLQERQRIRLFVHPDRFGRFYSCIVFVPRERFTTQSRLVIPGDPRGDVRRDGHRVHGTAVGVGAGPALLRHPRRCEAGPELRHRGPGAPPPGGEPHLGRRSARRAARVLRRGARHAPVPALRRGVPRRLPRDLLRAGRGARRGEDGAHRGGRHRDEPLPPARSGGGGGCASSSSRSGAARWCSPTRSRCWRTWV